MTQIQFELFHKLAEELSPENLTCDGELPQYEINRKLQRIRHQWKTLENEVGRKVSENEIWDVILQKQKRRVV